MVNFIDSGGGAHSLPRQPRSLAEHQSLARQPLSLAQRELRRQQKLLRRARLHRAGRVPMDRAQLRDVRVDLDDHLPDHSLR